MEFRWDGMHVCVDEPGPTFEEVYPQAAFAELIRLTISAAEALHRMLDRHHLPGGPGLAH